MSLREVGTEGERIACSFLLKKGYKILDTNFHGGRSGELDIIAKDGDTIVFVEVKRRRSVLFGTPENSVNMSKRRQIVRIAKVYLDKKNLYNHCCRFDVISIMTEKGKDIIEHHEDAFRPKGNE